MISSLPEPVSRLGFDGQVPAIHEELAALSLSDAYALTGRAALCATDLYPYPIGTLTLLTTRSAVARVAGMFGSRGASHEVGPDNDWLDALPGWMIHSLNEGRRVQSHGLKLRTVMVGGLGVRKSLADLEPGLDIQSLSGLQVASPELVMRDMLETGDPGAIEVASHAAVTYVQRAKRAGLVPRSGSDIDRMMKSLGIDW